MDLKQLRRQAGKRAEEVAVSLEIAVSTIRNWEQGKTVPKMRIDQFEKLCTLYACSFEELCTAFRQRSPVNSPDPNLISTADTRS